MDAVGESVTNTSTKVFRVCRIYVILLVLHSPTASITTQTPALTRRLEALEQMITQERNRLKTAPLLLQAEIEAHIQFMQTQVNALKKQVQAHMHSSPSLSQKLTLMTSIVGIGVASGAHIVAEIGTLEQFDSARQLAAYSGLTPQEQPRVHPCWVRPVCVK